MAVIAISSIGEPPSLQSEWEWQSPRSAARTIAPPSVSGPACSASRAASRSGSSPRTAAAITFAELAPTPGRSVRVPVSTARTTSASGIGRIVAAAPRNALTL